MKGTIQSICASPAAESLTPFCIIRKLLSYRRMLTVGDVAELLTLSPCTVYRRAQTKQIPSVVIGGSRRFNPASVAAWLAKNDPYMAASLRELAAASRQIAA